MKVSPIKPDNNVTIAQTTVIGFKIADIFKLAFGHFAGTTGEKGQRFKSETADMSSKSTGPPKQHESPVREEGEEEGEREQKYIGIT